jgi:hypothetical protein
MVRINWLVTCLATLGLAATAEAHFKLMTPAAYSQQSAYGDPQKSAPCGQADPSNPVVPTNAVTAVQSGAMLTISINETIFHPGHYRVAVAQDMTGLPADPPVTAGSTACGSTVINPSPTLPLLGDGLLVHTQAFSNPMQTMQVPIPANMTCTNCVLQVTQFMSNHGLNNPGGCFYHHCATVNISPDAPPPSDAGVDPGGGGGTGCCSASRGSAVTGGLGGLVVGLALLGRRRRRARR